MEGHTQCAETETPDSIVKQKVIMILTTRNDWIMIIDR